MKGVGEGIGPRKDFKVLPRSFFRRDTLTVARDLIGKLLVRVLGQQRVLVGRIVEVEAYGGLDDPASHAYRGNKGRAAIMFGEVGYAYVYFTYGNHYCLNVVAKDEKTPAGAVLFRALEPLEGIEIMMANRGVSDTFKLASGPGRLTQAFDITRRFNGVDLTERGELFLADGWLKPQEEICVSQRIGIREATDRPWRLYICGNPHVSKTRKQ